MRGQYPGCHSWTSPSRVSPRIPWREAAKGEVEKSQGFDKIIIREQGRTSYRLNPSRFIPASHPPHLNGFPFSNNFTNLLQRARSCWDFWHSGYTYQPAFSPVVLLFYSILSSMSPSFSPSLSSFLSDQYPPKREGNQEFLASLISLMRIIYFCPLPSSPSLPPTLFPALYLPQPNSAN